MNLLAIDPGPVKTAYCLIDTKTMRPLEFDIAPNVNVLAYILLNRSKIDHMAVEMVASYGMSVGAEVFDTCVMIGRCEQAADMKEIPRSRIFRLEEKVTICHDSRAKDTNIRRALIDRFARHDKARGTGTKRNPDMFYGFKKDLWAAYAVGVTWIDRYMEG